MRAYFFTNFYLSPIQHGIQSAHVLHEMFRKYNNAPMLNHYDTLCDWADNHKTIIVKNGGETNTMLRIKELCGKMNLPSAYFNEPSLDGALTCVGIIVPDRFYDRTVSNRFCELWKRSALETEFIQLLESTRLAQ